MANEKCDEKTGNDKDICVKEAKAGETRVKADAEAQMKTSAANEAASEKSREAGMKAKEESTEARQEAATEKRDGNYAVAKEKCDALAGDAKGRCMDEAKAKFGKLPLSCAGVGRSCPSPSPFLTDSYFAAGVSAGFLSC